MAKEKEKEKEKKPKEEQAEKKPKKGAADAKGAAAEKAAPAERGKGPVPRLKERYRNEIVAAYLKNKEYTNPMAIPKLQKIVVNMGLGEASRNIKIIDIAADEVARITGQKPVIRRARKAISSFKLREGMPIGVSVTLRGDIMYEFLDRLVSIALPRVRDFKGLSVDAFDGRGNYTMGLKDQLLFPEIDFAKVDKARGMNVTFVTTARSDDEARSLLSHLGLPFRKN
ncbi:MAG TPA: 50S ribosomal protein L5 [Acidobacteriota bacterium]|jgi:large subunit ribosomal protein L5|nr:50S ribosomal protein L5 [Acidobacteriota bacterium]